MRRYARVLWRVVALAAPAMLLGCTQNLGDFTLLATKNVDLSNLNTQAAENAPKATGIDKKSLFFGYGTFPSIKDAADRAEEPSNGVGLTNARIEGKYWTCIVYGETQYTVTGNPIPR